MILDAWIRSRARSIQGLCESTFLGITYLFPRDFPPSRLALFLIEFGLWLPLIRLAASACLRVRVLPRLDLNVLGPFLLQLIVTSCLSFGSFGSFDSG